MRTTTTLTDYNKNSVVIDWNVPSITTTLVKAQKTYFVEGDAAQRMLDIADMQPKGTIEGAILAYYLHRELQQIYEKYEI